MNNHRYQLFLLTLMYGLLVIVAIGYITHQQTVQAQLKAKDGSTMLTTGELMDISDFQRRLNELEPVNPIKVDGKLGPDTQAKWERILFNQYANN